MATITRTTTWSDGQTLTAAALNGEFNNALNAIAIVNADISGSAAIAISKITTGLSGSLVGTTDTQILTNKRNTKRVVTVTQAAEPTINTDNTDIAHITGLAQAVSSFTTNLSGTPVNGDTLIVSITDDGTGRAITWGAKFESSGNVTLPTTTVASTRLDIGFLYNTATSKWRCLAVA